MPTPPIELREAKRTVKAVEDALRKGFRPPQITGTGTSAVTVAAKALGIARTTIHNRMDRIEQCHGLRPNWELYKPKETWTEIVAKKPVVRLKAGSSLLPEGPAHRCVVIGDAHDSDELPDKSRFKWFGKHAAEYQSDYVIQIGDWGTFDSCSQHEPNDSIRGKLKPSFLQDRDSLEASLEAFNDGAKGFKGHRRITKGNHENRVPQFEDANPETEGLMGSSIDSLFQKHGWQVTEYGQFLFIGGVGFTHVPLNQLGKPYGGKNPETQIANDATFDIVYGHTHKDRNHKAPKIGPQNYVRVLNIGCALPYGHVERYARKSTTGWSYGIYNLTIQGGHIQSWEFIDMLELQRRYG